MTTVLVGVALLAAAGAMAWLSARASGKPHDRGTLEGVAALALGAAGAVTLIGAFVVAALQ